MAAKKKKKGGTPKSHVPLRTLEKRLGKLIKIVGERRENRKKWE